MSKRSVDVYDINELFKEKGWSTKKSLNMVLSFIEDKVLEDNLMEFLEEAAAEKDEDASTALLDDEDEEEEDVD